MYVSVEEVQKRNIEILNSLSSEYLEDRLSSISKEVDEYCNTRFEPTVDEYTCDLAERLKTRKQPLLSIDNLSICGVPKQENIDCYVYQDESTIEISDANSYEKRRKAVNIQYLYGYEQVPETVKNVIIALLCLEEEEKDPSSNIKSETWEDHAYTKVDMSKNKRKDIFSRLDSYKITADKLQVNEVDHQVRVMLL